MCNQKDKAFIFINKPPYIDNKPTAIPSREVIKSIHKTNTDSQTDIWRMALFNPLKIVITKTLSRVYEYPRWCYEYLPLYMCTLVLLVIISVNLPAKLLLKIFGFLSKLLASPIRNNFPKRPSRAPLILCQNYMMFPLIWTPSFEAVYCFICGRRIVAVARYRRTKSSKSMWCILYKDKIKYGGENGDA